MPTVRVKLLDALIDVEVGSATVGRPVLLRVVVDDPALLTSQSICAGGDRLGWIERYGSHGVIGNRSSQRATTACGAEALNCALNCRRNRSGAYPVRWIGFAG